MTSRLEDQKTVTTGCFRILSGHKETVTCLRAIDDENVQGSSFKIKIYTGSFDHTARCFDGKTGACLGVFSGHASYILCLKVWQDRLFTGSYDGTVRMWEADSDQCLQTWDIKKGMIQCLEAWEGVFITATPDHVVRIYLVSQGTDTGKVLCELKGHQSSVTSMQLVEGALGGEEEELFTASRDRTVRIWKHFSGECLRIIRFDAPPLTVIHVSEQWELFAAAGDVVFSVNSKTGEPHCQYECKNGSAKALCTNTARGQLFAASGHTVHIFDIDSGAILRSIAVPRGQVAAIGFNHGALFFSGDNTIRVFDCAPLIWWCTDGNEKAVSALLLNGENVEMKSISGSSPLLVACQFGHGEVVETLVHHGADIFATHAYDGECALHKAARANSITSVKILLRARLDPNFSTSSTLHEVKETASEDSRLARKDSTALHVAAECGHTEILLELLRWQSDVNWQCEGGYTPIMLAAKNGHTSCVTALIAFHANVQLKTTDARTAFSFSKPHRDTRQILLRKLLRLVLNIQRHV